MVSADYVVVGGGTAGLVIATRLSEDPEKTVIVLEAGSNLINDPRVQIPGLWTTLMGSEADWKLKTVPQPGLGGRIIKEPQGKLLGGSSAINGQTFIAASKIGIDSWAKLGNPEWTWDSLLPYYKKFYTLNLPDSETCEHLGADWVDESVQGTEGPIQVSFPAGIHSPLAKAWVDAFEDLGYKSSADPFSGTSVGAYSNTASINPQTKMRSHSASEYGGAALKRSNVYIATEALVHKIIFENSPNGVVAKGVEVEIEGTLQTVEANKEVILTAGSFNTPKILELSGIGNEAILRKFDIPVVIDNPGVGENLQDHLMSGISLEVVDGVQTSDQLLRGEQEAIESAMQMYAKHKSGPMTIGGVQSNGFMPMLEFSGSDGPEKRKQLFDKFLPSPTSTKDQISRAIVDNSNEASCCMFMFLAQANLHEDGRSFVGEQLHSGNFASLGICQSTPFSRGSAHISSSNPKDKPTIDPCFFSHPLDIEIMARNFLDLERVCKLDALAHFFKKGGRRNHPDAFLTDLDSAKKYLRDTAVGTYHPCGTASMLPRDKGGVVNEKLVVHGTTNLRVCCASVFPLVPRGNIMTTVYAVAERAADIIKAS